jgi:predicted HD superfamily hydrolase involved in NAD metabolism
MEYQHIVAQLSKTLSAKRLQHSIGVSKTAEKLAECFGCDKIKARLAGILHDLAREVPVDKMLSEAHAFGIVVNDMEKAEPILLHAPLAAKLAQTKFQIHDVEILQAIFLHTTGGSHMSSLDKIIYLADVIEPGRNGNDLEELRELAYRDLDKAMLMALDQSIRYILARSRLLHPATIEARNELLMKKMYTIKSLGCV